MERLDVALVNRGLASSRTRARRLIEEGSVSVDGRVVTKASHTLPDGSDLSLHHDGPTYVSRGAYKLLGAFEAFFPQGLTSPLGLRCLDIGASTGGFTQVLLEHGAFQVIALDVGHGQLDPALSGDPRITELNHTNIRDVTAESLGFRPQFVVSDVSFISLTYVLPIIADIVTPGADCILLVKPQFEVGKGNLGKDGVVTDPQLRQEALTKVQNAARAVGMNIMGSTLSPIEGTHGNVEYLLWVRAQ